MHAEPVLLVEDDEPEPRERDGRGQGGVRPDHEVDGAAREIARLTASPPRPPARGPRGARGGAASPRASAENVAWCCAASASVGATRSPWMPGRDRGQQRARGDRGLAAADVAEEEAPHRDRLPEVGEDLRRAPSSWPGVSGNGMRSRMRDADRGRGRERRRRTRRGGGSPRARPAPARAAGRTRAAPPAGSRSSSAHGSWMRRRAVVQRLEPRTASRTASGSGSGSGADEIERLPHEPPQRPLGHLRDRRVDGSTSRRSSARCSSDSTTQRSAPLSFVPSSTRGPSRGRDRPASTLSFSQPRL